MKTLHILLLLCLCLGGYGQSVWNKTYVEDRPGMLFGSVEVVDSGYVVCGVTYDYTNYQPKILLGTIDLVGDLNDYNIRVDSNASAYIVYTNSLIKTKKGELAFTGRTEDTVVCLLLGIADINYDSVSIFQYYTPNTYGTHGCSLLQYGSDYFIAGIYMGGLGYNADALLVKIDSTGNRIWEKHYGNTMRDEFHSIIKLANGNIMLGGGTNTLYTPYHIHTWLLEVDTNGNLVRQWLDSNDSTYIAEGLRQTQDGGFIYGAQKKNYQSGSSSPSYNVTVVKMNNNFSKQWVFARGGNDLSVYAGPTDIEELSDGNFIVTGNLAYYGVDTAANGWIVKLDTFGNVIWEKTYRGISASQSLNFLTDVDILPDGSIVAVGNCQPYNTPNDPPIIGWFLKLDSNGCEIENCLVGIDEPQAQQLETLPLHLYPNPATTEITITVDETMLGNLTITDITGRQVLAVTLSTPNSTLSIQHFAAGIYHVLLKRGAQTVSVGKFAKQ